MDNESITAISPVLPPSASPPRRGGHHLSSSLPGIPKKSQAGSQYEPKDDNGTQDSPHKIANYMAQQEGPNTWGSSVGRHLKRFPSEQVIERDDSRSSSSKRRRASSADITVHAFSKDPDSPIGSKQKRHRRTAAEIERGFKCTVSNCHKAYGTEGALKMHLRIKHPSLNLSSSSSSASSSSSSSSTNSSSSSITRSSSSGLLNTSMLQPLTVPSTPSIFPLDSPGFDNNQSSKVETPGAVPSFSPSRGHPSRLATPSPISPTALTIKTDPFAPDSNSTNPHSPLTPSVPSISPHTPSTPQTPAYPTPRDAHVQAPQQAPGSSWSVAGFSDHIKYSNVPVLVIRIGNWKKGTLFHGDIIAKFMYEERKFVWEVYAVTTAVATFFVRIELNFDDILAIGFETHQEIGLLTLDFRNPPTFYQAEIVPHQPVTWHPLAIDVSGGDIFTLRRHVLQFAKDAVMQPLQHLLKVEPRLHHLYSTSFDPNMFQPLNINLPHTNISMPPSYANLQDNINLYNSMPDASIYSNSLNVLPDSRSFVPSHHSHLSHPSQTINKPNSPDSSEGEPEEDMDQEKSDEKEKGSKSHPTIVPPNPVPHSFHHNTAPRIQEPNTFLNQGYFMQSFNSIPALELDPKETKLSTNIEPTNAQPTPRYSVVPGGGMQPCACGGNFSACVCLKGLGPCSVMCICARYCLEQLGDGAASVPPTPVLGSFPCDISF